MRTGRLEKEYHFTDRVFLNQKDIRELQLAKAAGSIEVDVQVGQKAGLYFI